MKRNRSSIISLTIGLWLLLPLAGMAQALSKSDSAAYQSIRSKAGEIYEHFDSQEFKLSKVPLIEGIESGIELRAYKKDQQITRIIAKGWTRDGMLSTEYYLEKEELIYVYRTFEYYSGTGPDDQWTNFKGLKGWEVRLYFSEDKPFHRIDKGTIPQASTIYFDNLSAEATKLIEQIKKG